MVPTTDTLALERFFDESGGMQLVLHAPFGSRINRAWGLALRKKFCQGFNFELQAAATEEGIILSLGASHSFPLEEVFRYLHPNTVRETLVQAVLDSPIFETRWRWTTTLALAVPRNRGGARIPNQLQRMYAEDLLQAVFPDAAACQDNIQGAREVPDHPLVNQALRDSLEEAMDCQGLEAVLKRMVNGEIGFVARDTPEPSVLSHELLNSAVYTFLDDAPLEERRTRAVYTRRATEPRNADDLGALDPAAIERVREEAWPVANTADEMHDALMVAGYIKETELAAHWPSLLNELGERAVKRGNAWFALERKDDDAARDSRQPAGSLGPVSAHQLDIPEAETALLALEGQGRVLRGRFTPETKDLEWCDRRLLARIHRYTLNKLRAEIEPVTAADFMRFLLHWQHVAGEDQVKGVDGLMAVVEQLEGFELAAAAWENDVLPARVADYDAGADRPPVPERPRGVGPAHAGLEGAAAQLADRADAARASRPLGRRDRRRRSSSRPRRRRCTKRWRSAAPRSSTSWLALQNCYPATSSAGLASWRARASPPPTASPACARCSRRRRSARTWSRPRGAGRCSSRCTTMTWKRSPARCSSATAWCSACCCSANRTCRRGASWCASIAAWKRAAKSAAGASSPASAASSSPRPTPSAGCARCARARRPASWWC